MRAELQAKIKELKDASAKAFEDAKAIKKELQGIKVEDGKDPYSVWPSDKVEQFVKATDEAATHAKEAQRLEDIANAEGQFAAVDEYHKRPVNSLPIGLGGVEQDSKQKARREAMHAYLTQENNDECHRILSEAGFSAQERHALIAGTDTLGGYLVPDDFRAEVLKRQAQMSVMRSICRIVPCSGDTLVWPRVAAKTSSNTTIYSSNVAGAYRAETGGTETGSVITPQDQPTFEQLRIPIHNYIPAPIVLSQSLLQDAAVPVESIVADLFAETKTADEDGDFLNGTGSNKPKGLLQNSSVSTTTGGSGAVSYSTLLDFVFGLPSQYTPGATILMRRATLGKILALEDTGTTLIFPPNAAPNTLYTFPIKYTDWVPAVASSAKCIIIGNFQNYIVGERQELRIQRLVERFAPNVGLQPMARFGGDVAIPEAFRFYVPS